MNKIAVLIRALRDALLLIRGRVCRGADSANLVGELERTEEALAERCDYFGDEAAAAEAMATEYVSRALKCRAARANADRTAKALYQATR